ncbi:hypothetical protein TIFTF001_001824 [Ficus carica]|uniref:F-box domain-containing protein n=1 Tax=Ficus carica TaxID=3494 RepID=A0AA87Z885_FICCA|nr:hypothetical protein TIFTF001_001824 [Ficus carica]
MDSHDETKCQGIDRTTRREDKRACSTAGIESLPREIIHAILSKLPISSLIRFKCVCRAWRMLAQDPQLLDLLKNRSLAENQCLIFHTDYPICNQLQFVDLMANNKEEDKLKKIQTPIPQFNVVLSCSGLLLLSDSLCNIAYVFNPFTKDCRQLPSIQTQYPNQKVVLGFGFEPMTKEYKVVKIIYYYHKYEGHRALFLTIFPQSKVQVLTLGSSSWRSLGKAPQYVDQSPSRVLVNGRLHWLICPLRYRPGRNIVSFDLADEQFKEVPKPDVVKFSSCDYLVELKRCLSAVFYAKYGELEIWVMKDYGVKESWVKEFHIGRYVPKALEEELENRVYEISGIAKRGRHNYNRVLCVLRNGEILIEKRSRALIIYDPKTGKFKDLMFHGMPSWFETVVHLGSLD